MSLSIYNQGFTSCQTTLAGQLIAATMSSEDENDSGAFVGDFFSPLNPIEVENSEGDTVATLTHSEGWSLYNHSLDVHDPQNRLVGKVKSVVNGWGIISGYKLFNQKGNHFADVVIDRGLFSSDFSFELTTGKQLAKAAQGVFGKWTIEVYNGKRANQMNGGLVQAVIAIEERKKHVGPIVCES